MKTLHFGIEMEMTGITREKAANLMAGFFGTGRGTYEGGAYDTTIATPPWITKDGPGKP